VGFDWTVAAERGTVTAALRLLQQALPRKLFSVHENYNVKVSKKKL
jgi:hypothetical protein